MQRQICKNIMLSFWSGTHIWHESSTSRVVDTGFCPSPRPAGWKARVIEACEDGSSDEVGIEASGETRGAADEAAERKLRRLLQSH